MEQCLKLLTQATGITCHSQEVLPGYIFVAINGSRVNGNLFAEEAARRGALAIVSDAPDTLPNLTIPVITVPNARQALAALAANFYSHPSRDLYLVGVTGTNGKTTITCMLEHIFRAAKFKTGLIGTVRTKIDSTFFPSQLTTPDAVKLQQYLAQMRQCGVTHAAMEVSAQGIEMHRVDEVQFSCGIISNICPDHLDFHGSFAGYLAAKKQFFSLLAPTTPLIVNIADPYCRRLLAYSQSPTYTAAVDIPADIEASDLILTAGGSTFYITVSRALPCINGRWLEPGRWRTQLSLPGRHNIENALLAAAAAFLHGIAPETVCRALAGFKGVERRMSVSFSHGFTVIDDTALNPGSIDAVFTTLRQFEFRQLIVVNAIRGNRGPAINAANAAVFACWQKTCPYLLIVTASKDSVGANDLVSPTERAAFIDTLRRYNAKFIYTETLDSAIGCALRHVRPGDAIALLGAQGMDDGLKLLSAYLKQTAAHPDVAMAAMTSS